MDDCACGPDIALKGMEGGLWGLVGWCSYKIVFRIFRCGAGSGGEAEVAEGEGWVGDFGWVVGGSVVIVI